ncbi:MAG: hypothetical protein WD176_09080, partial [Pirellulales bacterium]
VTERAASSPAHPLADLTSEIVLRAIGHASDAKYPGDALSATGLAPWQVKRVFVAVTSGATGAVELATARLNPRTGRSIAEEATTARALLIDRPAPAAAQLAFRLASELGTSPEARRDFFAGLGHDASAGARRSVTDSQGATLDSVKRAATARRNVKAILSHGGADREARRGWLAQWNELTRGLDDQSAAELAFQLGQTYVESGQWDLAAEAFESLARRYPQQPLARPALAWLANYAASEEAAVRLGATPKWPVVQASAPAARAARNKLSKAVEIAPLMEKIAPALAAEPQVQLALASLERREARRSSTTKGAPALAGGYQTMLAARPHDVWWSCADGERWLLDRRGRPPKPVLRCVRVSEKPYLDGKLDDAVWQKAESVELRPLLRGRAELSTTVRLAHDGEFLYAGIRCRRANGVTVAKLAAGERTRDVDLAGQDRIELLLDVDRDYGTYHRLAVDARGCSADACWGDATWNPQWFLATAADEDAWVAEAAIPLAALSPTLPQPGDAWALGLVRLVPAVGILSWSGSASPEGLPAGCGYVIFD